MHALAEGVQLSDGHWPVLSGLDQSGIKTAFGIDQAYDIITYDALDQALKDPWGPGGHIYRVSAKSVLNLLFGTQDGISVGVHEPGLSQGSISTDYSCLLCYRHEPHRPALFQTAFTRSISLHGISVQPIWSLLLLGMHNSMA